MHSSLDSTGSIVAEIERALDQATAAADERAIEEATRKLAALGRDLGERLAMAAPALRLSSPGADRRSLVHQIRRLIGA